MKRSVTDFERQSELASALMLLHDDDFACTVTVSAGNALFESDKLMTLMQNIAREHVFEEDLFAKWSNSLFPLERAGRGGSERPKLRRGDQPRGGGD